MHALPRWRSLLILKDSVIQSTIFASASNNQLAAFHSTRVTHEKWRNKWTPDHKKWTPDERSNQIPSKDYAKYKIRLKRADAKKALKNLLFNGGCYNVSSKETYAETKTLSDLDEEDHPTAKYRSKSSHATRQAAKAEHKRMKRKLRRDRVRLRLENDDPENVFQESVGRRGCTWSYWSFGEAFYQAGFGKHSSWKYKRHRESDFESEAEPNTEPCGYGTKSERQILGLPLRGPLNIEDIKKRYRLSVLKWHPDMHQGSAKVVASEKFKLCVDAYQSLCKSLPAAA